jgi:hypothetical protein
MELETESLSLDDDVATKPGCLFDPVIDETTEEQENPKYEFNRGMLPPERPAPVIQHGHQDPRQPHKDQQPQKKRIAPCVKTAVKSLRLSAHVAFPNSKMEILFYSDGPRRWVLGSGCWTQPQHLGPFIIYRMSLIAFCLWYSITEPMCHCMIYNVLSYAGVGCTVVSTVIFHRRDADATLNHSHLLQIRPQLRLIEGFAPPPAAIEFHRGHDPVPTAVGVDDFADDILGLAFDVTVLEIDVIFHQEPDGFLGVRTPGCGIDREHIPCPFLKIFLKLKCGIRFSNSSSQYINFPDRNTGLFFTIDPFANPCQKA